MNGPFRFSWMMEKINQSGGRIKGKSRMMRKIRVFLTAL
jgi:hypothetical protein